MKYQHTALVLMSFYFLIGQAQQAPEKVTKERTVVLVEKKGAKRTELYLKNNTDQIKNVFLKINPTGYRRSSNLPIIRDIPANSHQHVMTLIPLKDVPSTFTFTLITNEEKQPVNIDHSKGPIKEANVASILEQEIVVFIKNDCQKCAEISAYLHQQHLAFREINIDDRDRFYDYMWKRLEADGYQKNSIHVPIVVYRGALHYPIDKVKDFVQNLTQNLTSK